MDLELFKEPFTKNNEDNAITPQATKRLLKDLKAMDEKYTLDAGVTASPEGDNLLLWSGVIFGPDETIWEGGMFKVKIVFPGTYPQKPPKVFMLSKGVFHPNICPRTGWICLDIFKGSWSPAYEVGSFLIAIKSILNDPNLKSMANPEAGDLFMKDYNAYKQKAIQAVENSLNEE